MRRFMVSLAALGVALAVVTAPAYAAKDKTLVDRVVELSGASGFDSEDADFDILREAVLATELDRKLAGTRQFTVFAPRDSAFLELTGAASEQEAFDGVAALGLSAVRDVLKYHIAPGRRAAKQVVGAKRIPTLLKGEILRKRKSSTTLKDATGRKVEIVAPDAAKASNGIVHVIDQVLLPFEP